MSTSQARVADYEHIYRSIHSIHWVTDESRVSSAAFKNKLGVSVDVEHGRSQAECISTLAARFPSQAAVIRLSVSFCRSILLEVEYAHEVGNPHHAHLLNDDRSVNLPSSKIKKLRDLDFLVLRPA